MNKLKVAISGINIEFKSSRHGRFIRQLKGKYCSFLTNCACQYVFLLSTENLLKKKNNSFKLETGKSTNCLKIARSDFISELNLKKNTGLINIEDNVKSFDSFLRILYTFLLLERKGFLIHASGVKFMNTGLIFPGRSYSGKTTTAGLLPRGLILSDEIVGIRMVNKHKFGVSSTPFWGDLEEGLTNKKTNIFLPLNAVFFLKKSKKTEFSPFLPSQTLKHLLQNILFFSKDPVLIQKLLETATLFSKSVKAYKMKFHLHKYLWKKISKKAYESLD
ncbi:MAG: hypothetical protein JW983_03720 [Elusimicrobia bacterium]|nr:hypothetical protein [Elusimicrobiota bacterium]